MRIDQRLVLSAEGELEIVMARAFAAPRALVFQAFTQPEHLARWLGPRTWVLETCTLDLRVGGAWRYVMRGPSGERMGIRGVYREVVPHQRLVTTESFDGGEEIPQGPVSTTINTTTFEERDGQTQMMCRLLFESRALRDRRLATNMARGMDEGFRRLDELLATRAQEEVEMVKKIAFTVYPVKDMKRARAFYEGELGLVPSRPHDVWLEYDPPGGCFALTTVPTMEPSDRVGGLIALEVDDVDGLTERLRGKGIVVKAEPFSSPVCRMSVVVDPEGNALLLHQLTKHNH